MAFLTNSYGPMIYGNYQILAGQDSKGKRKHHKNKGVKMRKAKKRKESKCKLLVNTSCSMTGITCPFSHSCGAISKCKYRSTEDNNITLIIKNKYLSAIKDEINNYEQKIEKLGTKSTVDDATINQILKIRNEIKVLEGKYKELEIIKLKEFKHMLSFWQIETKKDSRKLQKHSTSKEYVEFLEPIVKIIKNYQKEKTIKKPDEKKKRKTVQKTNTTTEKEKKRSFKDFYPESNTKQNTKTKKTPKN